MCSTFGTYGGDCPATYLGFFCSWLYAVMRPRFGPGAKTALIVGSAIYFIDQQENYIIFAIRDLFMARHFWNIFQASRDWFMYVAAAYIAGWQYRDKPS
jgi:hypothetical protein